MPRRTTALLMPHMMKPHVVGEITQDGEKLMFTADQIAAKTGATVSFIERAMRGGKLRYKIVGKRHLVPKHDMEAFFESISYANVTVRTRR